MTDEVAIEECVVDGSPLLEAFDADEHGVRVYFVCRAGEHTYPSANVGYGPYPIDQGDY